MSIPILDPHEARRVAADRVKAAKDIKVPYLDYWNYDPCPYHDEPTPTCEYRLCGGPLWSHQRIGMSWMYVRQRGMLADGTGTGKTNQVLSMLALMKQKGELTNRAIIITQTPAAAQWLQEAQRWVPKMNVVAALSGMTRDKRINLYVQNFDILIIGYHLLLRDISTLTKLGFGTVIIDDVDPILDHTNATHKACKELVSQAEWRIVVNATNLQVRLQQIHAAGVMTDGEDVWGTLGQFERRYIRQEPVVLYNHRKGTKVTSMQVVGYKNMPEFKERLKPMVLRRTDDQLDDVNMPKVLPPTTIWLDLHPEQKRRYAELQQGVLRLLRDGGKVKRVAALAKVTYGQQICAGLPALKEADGVGASSKLDWLMHQLTGEWSDDKIVCFIRNIGMVEALEARCRAAGVGTAHIRGAGEGHGEYSDAEYRAEEIRRFWDDPDCRVMIGTTAIERSLNLQCANKLVFVDMLLNPARMHQIVGRVKRGGSKFKHIYVYNLLCRETQEEKYLGVLEMRQGLIDFVNDEQNELFEALSPEQLLELISAS